MSENIFNFLFFIYTTRNLAEMLPVDARANISGSATAKAVRNHSGYSLVDEVSRPVSVMISGIIVLDINDVT